MAWRRIGSVRRLKKSSALRPIGSSCTVLPALLGDRVLRGADDVRVERAAQTAVRGDDEQQDLVLLLALGAAADAWSTSTRVETDASTSRSAAAYGRAAIIRSCARRSFAAATIFMALVICCVFLTLRIRRRRSIVLGIVWLSAAAAISFRW